MAKPISRREHALTDYSYIPTVAAAPRLFGFQNEPRAARLCGVFSGAILLSTLFTRAEWGVFRTLPYRDHLRIDTAVGVAALAMPWLFGFAHNARARDTFLAMGMMGIMAGTLSEPGEMPPTNDFTRLSGAQHEEAR